MRQCRTRVPILTLVGGALVMSISLGCGVSGAAAAPTSAAGLSGSWAGTWHSTRSAAKGRFSATLATTPAWWGGATVSGTVELRGIACFGALRVSGSYYRGNEYVLIAKGPDGTARLTFELNVANGPPRVLSGNYNVVSSGTACDSDSGRFAAMPR
jgi:hypothetical protein